MQVMEFNETPWSSDIDVSCIWTETGEDDKAMQGIICKFGLLVCEYFHLQW